MILKNKKAEFAPTIQLVEIIVIIIFAVMLGSMVSKASNPMYADQLVTAEDIAKTIEIAQSIPFDMHYVYPETLDGYTVKIEGKTVYLEPDEDLDKANFFSEKRSFSLREGIVIDETSDVDVSYFFVDKTNNKLVVDDNKLSATTSLELLALKKPSLQISFVPIKNLGDKKVLTDITNTAKTILEKDFDINDNGELLIQFKILEDKTISENKIYYSTTASQETEILANNILKELSKTLNFETTPLSKNYNKKTIEIDFANNADNLDTIKEVKETISDIVAQIIKRTYVG